MGNGPIKKFSLGTLSIAAFESERGGISFALPQKRTKNQAGEWENARTLFANDLAGLKFILDAAIRWAIEHEGQSRGRPQPTQPVTAAPVQPPPFQDDDNPF